MIIAITINFINEITLLSLQGFNLSIKKMLPEKPFYKFDLKKKLCIMGFLHFDILLAFQNDLVALGIIPL